MKQILNLILAVLSLLFIFLMGLIPFAIIYLISDILRVLLFNVFRYRRKVVTSNLKMAFPELGNKELNQLVRLSYKNLMDVIVESFKAFTMTRRQIINRHKILNPELIVTYFESGRSVISLPGHYGNWEWGSLSPALQLNYPIVTFYKPLSNPWADRFIKWNRARYGTILASIYRTTETFSERKRLVTAYVMAADQSPSNPDRAYWVNFLGLETAFLHGPEKHARNYNLPVVFVDIQRVKRGHYTMFFSLIADNPAEMKEKEITQAYARHLESAILKQPENWLWSHRRWKLKR
jgi:KDO2-lipid IV(A) lauroyltransferase